MKHFEKQNGKFPFKALILLLIYFAAVLFAVYIAMAFLQNHLIMDDTGNTSKNQTCISVYYPSENTLQVREIQKITSEWIENNPDVDITLKFSDHDSYDQSLKTEFACHGAPDIMAVTNTNEWASAGIVGTIPDSVSTMVKSSSKFDGKVCSVPIYESTTAIIYNTVLFKKYGLVEPETYDDFINICETLASYNIQAIALGGSQSTNLLYWMNFFLQMDILEKDPAWMDKLLNGKTNFTSDLFDTALTDYVSLLSDQYVYQGSADMDDVQNIDALQSGDTAMVLAQPWLFQKILDITPSAVERPCNNDGTPIRNDFYPFRTGSFLMPDRDGNTTAIQIQPYSWAISQLCLNNEDDAAAATSFLSFFYQRDIYRDFLKETNGFSTLKASVQYPAIPAQYSLEQQFRYANKTSVYFGNSDTPSAFTDAMQDVLYALLNGTITKEEAEQQLNTAWENAI